MTNITGDKTDEKIIMKAFKKHIIPFVRLVDSWNSGQQKNPKIDEKVIKVSKKDDVPGNAMKMSGEEKIKKLVYSGSNGTGSYEIKGKNLNVNGIRPRDKGFFVRHFTMKTGFRKANLYYDGVNFMDKNKKFQEQVMAEVKKSSLDTPEMHIQDQKHQINTELIEIIKFRQNKKWLISIVVVSLFATILGLMIWFMSSGVDVMGGWKEILLLMLGGFVGSFAKVIDFWFNNAEDDVKLLEHADD